MAVKMSQKRNLSSVRLISKIDDAVDEEKSDWDEYSKDPITNESAIKFIEGKKPTYFVCNFDFSGKQSASVKDAMVKIDEEKNPSVAYGRWGYKVAQIALKDIENPPDVPEMDKIRIKKDGGTGYVMESVMTDLERLGVVAEIFQHYLTLSQTPEKKNAKNSSRR